MLEQNSASAGAFRLGELVVPKGRTSFWTQHVDRLYAQYSSPCSLAHCSRFAVAWAERCWEALTPLPNISRRRVPCGKLRRCSRPQTDLNLCISWVETAYLDLLRG
jgi:hypothetical protein